VQFCEICGYLKSYDNYFFSPLSFVDVLGSGIRDPGSGMGKNQDPGSGINIPDPPHWFLVVADSHLMRSRIRIWICIKEESRIQIWICIKEIRGIRTLIFAFGSAIVLNSPIVFLSVLSLLIPFPMFPSALEELRKHLDQDHAR